MANPKAFRHFLVKKQTSPAFLKGFTLIELIVVIAMIGVMISLLLIFINPFKQIEKAKDAQRQENLKQINNALDTYYNDNNCYPPAPPAAGSFSFGSSWQVNSTVYMKMVPQDPDCSTGGGCYTYIPDNSSCPQWYAMFTKVYNTTGSLTYCSLENIPNCTPANYSQSGYNSCVVSGQTNCAYIHTLSLPIIAGAQGGSNPTPTVTPGPNPTNTPTPTPTPTPFGNPTPTLVPGGCYCSSCNSFSQQCYRNPNCNVAAPPVAGNFCDRGTCRIQCQ